jgi:uncharacterized damage-inducible protein DinB
VTKTPYVAGEREMLLAYLQRQRDLVVWKLENLSDDDARNVATPSGLTIHGLVHHLQDVERFWLRRWFAGQRGLPVTGIDENHVGEPRAPEGVRLTDLLTTYVQESQRCDEVVAAHELDDVEAEGPRTLRWVLHHLCEETARHLGHLDLLCELADGRTGEEPSQP